MHSNKLGFLSTGIKVLFKSITVVLIVVSALILHGRTIAPTANAGNWSNESAIERPDELPTSGDIEIDRMILEAAAKHGVDPKLVYYVIRQESNFKNGARSNRDARGLMQLIPATAERFNVENPHDPQQNIEGGVRYLRWLLKEFNGDVKLALAGYNAGEGAVKKCGNQVPDYQETKNYVKKIVSAYGRTHHPVLSPEQARVRFGLVDTDVASD